MEVWAARRWPWGLGAVAVLCLPCQALRGTKVPKILEASSGWASGHGEGAVAPNPMRVLASMSRIGMGRPLAGRCQDLAHSHIITVTKGGRLLQGLGRSVAVGVVCVQQVLVNKCPSHGISNKW